jgi:hypothetical protein
MHLPAPFGLTKSFSLLGPQLENQSIHAGSQRKFDPCLLGDRGAELTCLVILLRYKVHHGHWMLQCVHASDVIDLK